MKVSSQLPEVMLMEHVYYEILLCVSSFIVVFICSSEEVVAGKATRG